MKGLVAQVLLCFCFPLASRRNCRIARTRRFGIEQTMAVLTDAAR